MRAPSGDQTGESLCRALQQQSAERVIRNVVHPCLRSDFKRDSPAVRRQAGAAVFTAPPREVVVRARCGTPTRGAGAPQTRPPDPTAPVPLRTPVIPSEKRRSTPQLSVCSTSSTTGTGGPVTVTLAASKGTTNRVPSRPYTRCPDGRYRGDMPSSISTRREPVPGSCAMMLPDDWKMTLSEVASQKGEP